MRPETRDRHRQKRQAKLASRARFVEEARVWVKESGLVLPVNLPLAEAVRAIAGLGTLLSFSGRCPFGARRYARCSHEHVEFMLNGIFWEARFEAEYEDAPGVVVLRDDSSGTFHLSFRETGPT